METNERQITLTDLLAVAKRYFILILAVGLVFGGLGYAYFYLTKTEYYTTESVVYFHTATADMIEGPDANDISRARALAASCAEVFPNDALIDNIRAHFKARRADRPEERWEDLDAYSDAAIKSMLAAATEQSSQKLTITVNAPTATLACHLANATAGELQVSILDTVGNCRVELTSQAKSAYLRSDFSMGTIIALAGAGAFATYLFFFALYFLNPHIRTPKELMALSYGVSVIGTVGARRTPVSLLDGRESSAVRESYNVVRVSLLARLADGEKTCPVVGLTGIGSSEESGILTMNLATSLSRLSRRVLVIDADYFGESLASLSSLSDASGLTDAAANGKGTPALIGDTGVFLLPRGKAPENAADFLGSAAFAEIISRLRKEYDMVIVKLPSPIDAADAMTAASALDSFVVGLPLNGLPAAKLTEAVRRLEDVGAKVLGIIGVER